MRDSLTTKSSAPILEKTGTSPADISRQAIALCPLLLALWAVIVASLAARAELPDAPRRTKSEVALRGVEWCQTHQRFSRAALQRQRNTTNNGCPTEGACDIPTVRDQWVVGPQTPITTIRLKFNVFAFDNGDFPAASTQEVTEQVAQINSDFLPSRVQFVYALEVIHDEAYLFFDDSEEAAMKTSYADHPEQQLNVYVLYINGGYLGVATFPWDPVALADLGGVIIDADHFGSGEKTLTHELGHALGLWHTHHGVSEFDGETCFDDDDPCDCPCYEAADGSLADTAGDFCSDTPPTPVNYTCADPGVTDSCSSIPWGTTSPENFMSYAPDTCYSEFTEHQTSRLKCWINDQLTSWIGAPSLTVSDSVSPLNDAMIVFANTPLGGSSSESFTIANDGDAELVIGSWVSSHSAFSLIPTNPYGPAGDVTISPGELPIDVQVQFMPTEERGYDELIGIASNDPGTPVFWLTVTGTGIANQSGISLVADGYSVNPSTPVLLTATVIGPSGSPVGSGEPVDFATAASGSGIPTTVLTDSTGQASVTWIPGELGYWQITATHEANVDSVWIDVVPGAVTCTQSNVTPISIGDTQSTYLAEFRFENSSGNPISYEDVAWEPPSIGVLDSPEDRTDSLGQVQSNIITSESGATTITACLPNYGQCCAQQAIFQVGPAPRIPRVEPCHYPAL
jgi:hypothetical protein